MSCGHPRGGIWVGGGGKDGGDGGMCWWDLPVGFGSRKAARMSWGHPCAGGLWLGGGGKDGWPRAGGIWPTEAQR